ncbi:Hypothetical predicted protein [Marmota monax]|uniref:Uncharacterized protein n=1 Tax=Marmota monax TaxID=9995 RepID=A0A5E4A8G5_MARMO|nr:Hypothetical predicted protein [Marmota monax]
MLRLPSPSAGGAVTQLVPGKGNAPLQLSQRPDPEPGQVPAESSQSGRAGPRLPASPPAPPHSGPQHPGASRGRGRGWRERCWRRGGGLGSGPDGAAKTCERLQLHPSNPGCKARPERRPGAAASFLIAPWPLWLGAQTRLPGSASSVAETLSPQWAVLPEDHPMGPPSPTWQATSPGSQGSGPGVTMRVLHLLRLD